MSLLAPSFPFRTLSRQEANDNMLVRTSARTEMAPSPQSSPSVRARRVKTLWRRSSNGVPVEFVGEDICGNGDGTLTSVMARGVKALLVMDY